jgi:hypothetical protein
MEVLVLKVRLVQVGTTALPVQAVQLVPKVGLVLKVLEGLPDLKVVSDKPVLKALPE